MTHLGGEQHAPDDLEDVVSPGDAGVGPHHGHQVADTEDGHHDDQGLGEIISCQIVGHIGMTQHTREKI